MDQMSNLVWNVLLPKKLGGDYCDWEDISMAYENGRNRPMGIKRVIEFLK